MVAFILKSNNDAESSRDDDSWPPWDLSNGENAEGGDASSKNGARDRAKIDE